MIKECNFEKTPKRIRMLPTCWAVLLRELLEGAKSYADLETATGVPARTLRDWMAPLRIRGTDRRNLIHISGWRVTGSGAAIVPEFSWNPGAANVKRVKVGKSETQRSREYRGKKKAMELHGIMSSMVSTEVRV